MKPTSKNSQVSDSSICMLRKRRKNACIDHLLSSSGDDQSLNDEDLAGLVSSQPNTDTVDPP